MQDTKIKINDCLQDEPAFCTAACPFALDVRSFAQKVRRGSFQSAFKTYRDAVGFPAVVSSLCPAPCKGACPRKDADEAVALDALERAAVAYAANKAPTDYNVPKKAERVAVVGAGPGGLACALRLCQKKYGVTIYERADEIGGRLLELPEREALLADIREQFLFEEYDIRLAARIETLDKLAGYAAVYFATGAGGDAFGCHSQNGYATDKKGVFSGALPRGASIVDAIAHGLEAFNHIEHYLKTGTAGRRPRPAGTRMVLDSAALRPVPFAPPAGAGTFTREAAQAEAARCMCCRCDACHRHCEFLRMAKKFPKRLMDEAEASIHPSKIDGSSTIGNRDISSCNLCGLCGALCPKDIDLGEYYLTCRRAMQANGTMPWAFHDFWLNDMAFTNGEAARVAKMPNGCHASRYLFFPGCQLGASEPDYVTGVYRLLRERYPDTALHTGCCGAPAVWAGNEPLQSEVTAQIRKDWNAFGNPVAVFACPSCQKMFRRYLPEIQGVFWADVVRHGSLPKGGGAGKTLSVFDPCASRDDTALQDKIRQIALDMGYSLEPLAYERDRAQCCSWGGHVSVANPRYAAGAVRHRAGLGEAPYLAYCVNCRDAFAAAGKACHHILDLVLELDRAGAPLPTPTRRRQNRRALKARVLKEFWNEDWSMEQTGMIRLSIPEDLREKMGGALILEEEIEQVVAHCEATGQKVLVPGSGNFAGHAMVGHMTYWAEYRPDGAGGFELLNAYGHRMEIESL